MLRIFVVFDFYHFWFAVPKKKIYIYIYLKSWLVVQNLRIALIKMFISSKLFVFTEKQRDLQKSNVIYQFSCHCDSGYVGRTFQRLQDRIKQHVSKSIRSCSSSQKRSLPARRCKSSTQTNNQSLASDSAIGLHLLQNPICAQHYDDRRFSILAQGRSPFHLSALEATFIKTTNPALCRQKEFVYRLKIVY